jgi:hypothetical protein
VEEVGIQVVANNFTRVEGKFSVDTTELPLFLEERAFLELPASLEVMDSNFRLWVLSKQ